MIGKIGVINDVDGIDRHHVLDMFRRFFPDRPAYPLRLSRIVILHRDLDDAGIAGSSHGDPFLETFITHVQIKIRNDFFQNMPTGNHLRIVFSQLRAGLQFLIGRHIVLTFGAIEHVHFGSGLELLGYGKFADTKSYPTDNNCRYSDKP